MLEKLVHFCTRYMAAGVILAGVCGIIWPSLMKPFACYIPIFLGVIMFGMGMSLTPRDFKNVFDHPKNIALGTLFQFIFMPALAFALVKLFALPPAIAIGVILVGCCPGGTASNVISYIARADVALSVSMTMVNTILAPFVTPFLIWVTAGAWVDISFTSMMISIIEMVLLPLLSGVLLNIFFPKAVSKVTKITPMLSALVILHNLGGMTLGYLAAKKAGMTKAQVRAMSIEVGMQNSGLASTLALMYFTAAGGIAGAIFSVWHNISGSLFASWCAGKDEKEEMAPAAETRSI